MKDIVVIQKGAEVAVKGRRYTITSIDDNLACVTARDIETGALNRIEMQLLEPPPELTSEKIVAPDFSSYREKDLIEADRRVAIIKPRLDDPGVSVDEIAAKHGLHRSTVYRFLAKWETTGQRSALVPQTAKRGGPGKSRLGGVLDGVVEKAINSVFLGLGNRKVKPLKVIEEIMIKCKEKGLKPPHPNTIRRRIDSIPIRTRDEARGDKRARERHHPYPGHFPDADWPLAVVQIDHTPIDTSAVDDIYRKSVGRPWLTIALDVCSRMVTGFYLSFLKPGAMAMGLCLARAILSKETWLAKLGVPNPWPLWGIMDTVHADNAGEFRGNLLQYLCKEYFFTIQWRPVAKPCYGAHIERLAKTLNDMIHSLPGTTFSNIQDRGDYDSDEGACMAYSDLERWLAEKITGEYHLKPHSALEGMSPLQKFLEGIHGTNRTPGRGVPNRMSAAKETRLRTDFMPYFERTVQQYGVVFHHITYYDGVLSRRIHEKDPKSKKTRKFRFHYWPPDLSKIYFFDPDENQYFEIPYADTTRDPISLWELRAAQAKLKEQGVAQATEDAIFNTIMRTRDIEEKAAATTKKARRHEQMRRTHKEQAPPQTSVPTRTATPVTPPSDEDSEPIEPFTEDDDHGGRRDAS